MSTVFPQTATFTGFAPGNLVVSRSVYTGDSSSVAVGQKLPPICPSTAACGTALATDNGAFPSIGSSNNVFNNDKIDGSFGITSPIFLDQITTAGALVSTFAVPTGLLTTSFPSKSELALNLSTDGRALTFMGYPAPSNTLDVSNSNTPGVYDATNPVGTSYFRAVAQISANGAIQITDTNAYNGNNGRAAILANGLYYLVGNSNNGAGTPANVVGAAGVQLATPGQSPITAPAEIGSFSISQFKDPATGLPYAADKLGKDNNFRGLTIFNNTLYVTKGSGGNGINTVYQVGTAGTLPTLATAASAPITVLPGLPTTLAKNADATNPFGIFFANATTLYVADEGTGVAADAATSKAAGIQKWTLVNGTWQLLYVMQAGLNLGQAYTVANYPVSLNPSTDGIRNLAGRVNADGTVNLYGVTSTVSSNGDQGADPNLLVTVTDTLANTNATTGAAQKFAILKSAGYKEVLRGVSFTPTAASTPGVNVPSVYSAASNGVAAIAPGSLATVYGVNLATGSPVTATSPLPVMLAGTSVMVTDSTGKNTAAPLLYVSPSQINFQVPASAGTGVAIITVTNGSISQSVTNIQISAVAPSLFTLNPFGLAAAGALLVSANGTQTSSDVYSINASGGLVAKPINLGGATDTAYLTLYGTGLQAAQASGVAVTINGMNCTVLYAGAQGTFPGLDQVNVRIPASLAGTGNVNVQLTVSGVASNPVQIAIQ